MKNPTKEEFVFYWKAAPRGDQQISCFHCHTPNGKLSKGKSDEMIFSFVPQTWGVFEEFYFFHIPFKDIQVTFLLVGIAREPKVSFNESHLDLPSTVIGVEVSENIILKNYENEKYSFKFGKLPMLADCFKIEPKEGVLDVEESLQIK